MSVRCSSVWVSDVLLCECQMFFCVSDVLLCECQMFFWVNLSVTPWLCFILWNVLTSIYQLLMLTHSITHSLTHPFIHSPTHPLTHSFTHQLTKSLTNSLTHSLTHSLTQSLTNSPNHSPTNTFTHSSTHPLIQSLTHSFTHSATHSITSSPSHSPTNLPTHPLTHPLTHTLTHSLIPHSTVLLQKLTGSQPVKKFLTFHGTRRFITAFTSARHLSLSWASSIQSTLPNPTFRKSILILSSYLRLGLPSGSPSPRHGASSGCRWTNDLRYGGQLRMYWIGSRDRRRRVVLQLGVCARC